MDVALTTLTIHRYTQLLIMCKIAKDNDNELTISLCYTAFAHHFEMFGACVWNKWATGNDQVQTKKQLATKKTEAEFLDVIGTKILRLFQDAIHRHLYYSGFYSPPLVFLDLIFLQIFLQFRLRFKKDRKPYPPPPLGFQKSIQRINQ